MGADKARHAEMTGYLETLHASNLAFRRYTAVAEDSAESVRVALSDLDVFLLRQIAEFYPQLLTVIDLAADATHGASAAVWAEFAGVSRVFLSYVRANRDQEGEQENFFRLMNEAGLDTHAYRCVGHSLNTPDGRRELGEQLLRPPLLFTLALSGSNASELIASLQWIVENYADALVCVLNVRRVDESRDLEMLLTQLSEMPLHRVYLPRETTPFLYRSRIALIAKQDNALVADVLTRIVRLYEGNFQFITLIEAAVSAMQREKALQARLEERERTFERHLDEQHNLVRHRDEQCLAMKRDLDYYMQRVREKDAHVLALKERANYLEQTYLPWKEGYIESLEGHIRNLSAGKLQQVSNAANRVIRVIRRR